MTAVASADDQLAWEADKRKPAAAAAIGGGLLSFAGFLVTILGLRGAESQSLAASLARFNTSNTPIGDQPSLRLIPYQFFADHAAAILIGAVCVGLGALAMSGALTYLAYATRARAERYPKVGIYLPIIGGVLMMLGTILSAVGRLSFYNSIIDGPGTVQAVRDYNPSGLLYVGQFVQLIGGLALALAFVLVALNAMRVGLLTRFMGIMGILAGALTILPLPAVPVLQAFWLVALGALILGVWPGGAIPPAWVTGRAEPWTSATQQRAERAKAVRDRKSGGRTAAPPEPAEVEARAADAKPHPSSKKKRKRRT